MPTNGLSGGTLPSSRIRSTLPPWSSVFCARSCSCDRRRSGRAVRRDRTRFGRRNSCVDALQLLATKMSLRLSAPCRRTGRGPGRRDRRCLPAWCTRDTAACSRRTSDAARPRAVRPSTAPHRRHAGDRLRIEHAVADDPQAALALGDEHVAVGQERQAPGMGQTGRDDADADLVERGFERLRQRRQGWRRPGGSRAAAAASQRPGRRAAPRCPSWAAATCRAAAPIVTAATASADTPPQRSRPLSAQAFVSSATPR